MCHKKNLICTICPLGCYLELCILDNKEFDIMGNICKRGADYAVAEYTFPKRVLTTVVRAVDRNPPMVPVKSAKPIPKNLIFDCMKKINECSVEAPVHIGDIIIENILDTGVNIIATGNID